MALKVSPLFSPFFVVSLVVVVPEKAFKVVREGFPGLEHMLRGNSDRPVELILLRLGCCRLLSRSQLLLGARRRGRWRRRKRRRVDGQGRGGRSQCLFRLLVVGAGGRGPNAEDDGRTVLWVFGLKSSNQLW